MIVKSQKLKKTAKECGIYVMNKKSRLLEFRIIKQEFNNFFQA
jgi:hypothetical protein